MNSIYKSTSFAKKRKFLFWFRNLFILYMYFEELQNNPITFFVFRFLRNSVRYFFVNFHTTRHWTAVGIKAINYKLQFFLVLLYNKIEESNSTQICINRLQSAHYLFKTLFSSPKSKQRKPNHKPVSELKLRKFTQF